MFPIATANIRPLNFTLRGRISHVTIPSFLFLLITATKIQFFFGIYVWFYTYMFRAYLE